VTDLAIYDMDRTITRHGTYTPWLLFWASRRAPWRLLLLPLACALAVAYLLGLISRGRLKELNHLLLMGGAARRCDVDATAEAFAARVVPAAVFPGALAQIAADRAEGRRIVLATASYEFYATMIARRLGIDTVIATRSVWRGDRLCAKIAGQNCYDGAKLEMVEAWLATLPAPFGHIRFYSDHVSDEPLFERANEAVATTPSPALRALAVQRNWEIIDWS